MVQEESTKYSRKWSFLVFLSDRILVRLNNRSKFVGVESPSWIQELVYITNESDAAELLKSPCWISSSMKRFSSQSGSPKNVTTSVQSFLPYELCWNMICLLRLQFIPLFWLLSLLIIYIICYPSGRWLRIIRGSARCTETVPHQDWCADNSTPRNILKYSCVLTLIS